MSRWQGLKSESSNAAPPRRIINSRWNDPQERTASNHATRKRTPIIKAKRTWTEIRKALADANDSAALENAVREVASLDANELRLIPAEQAAKDIVEAILLDILEKADPSSRLERSVLDAIKKLLQEATICSAITTPLTVNVAETTGVEERIPNPVGERLLLLLQKRLPESCPTLTILIDEIRKRGIADTLPLDFLRLQLYFSSAKRQQQAQNLEMLRLVLVTYTGAYKFFQVLFLSDYRFKSRDCTVTNTCPTCKYKPGTSLLLDALHSGQHVDQTSTCVTLLLQLFPLDAWLNPKTAGSMQFFGENVKTDLIRLLKSLVCQFTPTETFCNLITICVSTIPYSKNKGDPLTRHGINLVSCVAKAIMQDPSKNRYAGESFCECMGGRPRSNGGNTPTALPIALWLDSATLFREYLMTACCSHGNASHYAAAMRLLCAVVRTRYCFITLQQLQSIVESNYHNATEKRRVDALNLLERFAVGRSECVEPPLDQEPVSKFLVEICDSIKLDASRKVRQSCLQAYCAFLAVDWTYAVTYHHMESITESLKHYCEKGTSSEKPLAFKVLGEMLSKSFSEGSSFEDDYLSQLCTNLLPVLMGGLNESNSAPVRSMSVFAIGNLSLGIRDRNSQHCILSSSHVLAVIDLLCVSLMSTNDKVVGNAIRSIGHLAHVAFHAPYELQLDPTSSPERFRTIASKLTEKLRQAMGGASSAKLTWKERSSAKKHGWGACHSLGHLLDCNMAVQNLDHSKEACAALVNCIKLYDTLTEKIVLAAIVAMQRIEPTRLANFSRRTELVGLTVSFCLRLLVNGTKPRTHQRIKGEVDNLLLQLMPILSVLDAQTVLQTEFVASKHLEWLYEWMLQHNLNAGPYENFAMAFEQSNDWEGNISLEQRFASRAAWNYREGSTSEADRDLEEDEL